MNTEFLEDAASQKGIQPRKENKVDVSKAELLPDKAPLQDGVWRRVWESLARTCRPRHEISPAPEGTVQPQTLSWPGRSVDYADEVHP
jgi:hypothetical protein